MAKGNFIDYITSDDPNKYPSDGVHTDGYYYKKVTKSTSSTTPTEPKPTLPDAVNGALTFYSEAPFRMCITNKKKNWNGTLYYSLDNSNWNEWNGEFIEGTNGIIYMRGVGNTYLNTLSVGSAGAFHFETDTGCFMHCIGIMENLLDYTTTSTLADSCYKSMFSGCSNLTTAPELPATILANYCYDHMLSGCSNLTTAPELPATTLADYCYQYMFNDCTNIKLSETQTGEYQTAYRIPTSGTGTTGTKSLSNMFQNTGGTFTGTPTINTTYYLSTSNTVAGLPR